MKKTLILFITMAALTAVVFAASNWQEAYDANTGMFGANSPGGNHPHAPGEQGTNYEAPPNATQAGGLSGVGPYGPVYNHTGPVKCSFTCPHDMLQRPFPDCTCYEDVKHCTTECPPGYSQEPYPDCSCTEPVVIDWRVCDNTCPSGWSQSPYPDCVCLMPPTKRVCENECAAGLEQKPYPDCRCYDAAPPQSPIEYDEVEEETGWHAEGTTGWGAQGQSGWGGGPGGFNRRN